MDTSMTACFIVCRLIENSSVQVGTLQLPTPSSIKREGKKRGKIIPINSDFYFNYKFKFKF